MAGEAGASRSVRIRAMNDADTTNDKASTSSAIGALSTCTSSPPSAGPATYDADRLALSRLFAAMYSERGTSSTKKAG